MDKYKKVASLLEINLKKERISSLDVQEKDGLLEVSIKLDYSKYKNKLSAYSEVLKEYFSKDEIYVLTRLKETKGIRRIFTILFQNSKESVMSEMKSFSPNYLIQKGKTKYLLLTFENEYLKIYELSPVRESTFIFRGYRYKKANQLKLK